MNQVVLCANFKENQTKREADSIGEICGVR